MRAAITFTAFANLWWSLANLLPIRPLDGGNVATELLGASRARQLSILAAAAGGVWAYQQGQTYAALFAALLAFLNLSEIRAERAGARPGAFDVDAPAVPPRHLPPATGRRRRSAAGTAPSGPVRSGAGLAGPASPPDRARIEGAAWSALRADDARRARSLWARVSAAGGDPFLGAAVAVADGQVEAGLDLFVAAYRARPSGPPGLVAAEVLARAGAAGALAERLVHEHAGVGAAGSLQTHLHYAGNHRDAAQVGEVVHAAGPASPAQCAFEVACSWSRAGEVERALDWLERAASAGFQAASLVDAEPDLDPVRGDPRWPSVRSRLG